MCACTWLAIGQAITVSQMFGSLDVVANKQTMGIFAQPWRKANNDEKNVTWRVLDGPINAICIESMNTVMDDNRYACHPVQCPIHAACALLSSRPQRRLFLFSLSIPPALARHLRRGLRRCTWPAC